MAGRLGRTCAAALSAAALSLVACSLASAAAYEPNDSLPAAAGPLLQGQTYDATLDSSSDRDFFYFYVTSTQAQVSVTVTNLGDGQATSLNASLLDRTATPIDSFAYFLGSGVQATATQALPTQKYFLEVSPSASGSGTTAYAIAVGGGEGAFGPYSQIAAHCSKAVADTRAAKSDLNRAQGALQRAIARLRQSAYGTAAEHRAARSKFRKARARASGKNRLFHAAERRQRPWCAIPQ